MENINPFEMQLIRNLFKLNSQMNSELSISTGNRVINLIEEEWKLVADLCDKNAARVSNRLPLLFNSLQAIVGFKFHEFTIVCRRKAVTMRFKHFASITADANSFNLFYLLSQSFTTRKCSAARDL